MELSLGFDQVAIKQKKSVCLSRYHVITRSEVARGLLLDIPLIPSNMSTVVNVELCIQLEKLGSLGILHRAMSEDDQILSAKRLSKSCNNVAISIGTGRDQVWLAQRLTNAGANILVIDVAHAYCETVIETAAKIKECCPSIILIVGNTVNEQMLYEVNDFADAVKIGCGSGSACETANTAGCTERQFSAVYKMKEISKKLGLPIISDGGIRQPSDFTKAIGAGANSVMAGSIFARCPESAAEEILINGVAKKCYAGMASRMVQEKWRGKVHNDCPEGKTVMLDIGESVDKLLTRYAGALRSGVSYGGGKDIKSFQDAVEFIRLA